MLLTHVTHVEISCFYTLLSGKLYNMLLLNSIKKKVKVKYVQL